MAEWNDLRVVASQRGGLLYWPVEIAEGQDSALTLPHVFSDDEWEVYDWSLATEAVAKVIHPVTEAALASLTFVPNYGGVLGRIGFTIDRVASANLAANRAVNPHGADLRWAAEITLPGGHHIQLVTSNSPFLVRHKGV